MPLGLGEDDPDSFDHPAADRGFQERRIERARQMNQQPLGRFLLGIVIRVAVVFAIAAIVITAVQYFRG